MPGNADIATFIVRDRARALAVIWRHSQTGCITLTKKPATVLIDERIDQLGDWRGALLARLRGLIQSGAARCDRGLEMA